MATNDIKLKASVSRIVAFEKETGVSIMEAFGSNVSLTNVVALVKRCAPDDFDIDEYVEENGLDDLMNKLIEALAAAGFLPKQTK